MMLIKLVNFLLCRGQLSKPIEGQILAPKHKPEPFVLTLYKDSREMMVRRRPHSQDAKSLPRFGHRCLLNLRDNVTFLYPAGGGRTGRGNRSDRNDRLSIIVLSRDKLQANRSRPVVIENDWIRFRPR